MKDIFKFLCCGSVDDGKSTLIGRLLVDTNNVKKDQMEDAIRASQKNDSSQIEFSMLLDGLLEEREQQITIDIAHRFFDFNDIRFHILDCPGHQQYTKNMAIAAAEADAAIIVVDCLNGLQEQTREHIKICSLFHIKDICVCITKCDKILDKKGNIDVQKYKKTEAEVIEFLDRFNFNYSIIPVSAVSGINIDLLLEKICDFQKNKSKEKTDPFIMHVQSVKMKDGERFYYGRSMYDVEPIKNGIYTLYPSQKKITVVDVPVIGCIKIKEQVDIVRGDCISDIKLIKSSVISHKTIWFDKPVSEIYLKHGTNIVKIDRYTDNIMELNHPICFNNINDFSKNGFGVIIDWSTKKTIGCSVFLTNDLNQSIEGKTQKHGFVFWFTGLSGAGKTTLSRELLKQFSVKPIVLDADDIRAGLSSDLGFSPNDCLKNVDRIAHVAKLISEQGHNVIVTCISKFKEQRQRIKELIGDNYIEIFVNRSLEECHKNDAKGLYHALGRNNVIQNYEIGNSAFMTINTNKDTVEQSTNKMLKQLKKAKII